MELFAFIGVIIVFEILIPYKKLRFFKTGFFSDAGWYLFLQPGLLDICLLKYVEHFGFTHQFNLLTNRPLYVQLIITFFTLEFLYYWLHYFIHNSNLFWRFHELHHSSPEVNWLSGTRNHPVDLMINSFADTLIFMLLGVSVEVAAIIASINAFHGIWKHSNIKIKIGFLQYFFISSEMHRCHHLSKIEYQQSNYGNTLSIFDWLFGTAYYPDENTYKDIPFGTDKPYPQVFYKQLKYVFRPRELEEAEIKQGD